MRNLLGRPNQSCSKGYKHIHRIRKKEKEGSMCEDDLQVRLLGRPVLPQRERTVDTIDYTLTQSGAALKVRPQHEAGLRTAESEKKRVSINNNSLNESQETRPEKSCSS